LTLIFFRSIRDDPSHPRHPRSISPQFILSRLNSC
jgi:hypothetical protein